MASEFSLSMTETAVQDLDGIINYISFTLSNPQAAKVFFEALNDTFKTVVTFPDTGAPVDNPVVLLDSVRKLFVKNYTVFYSTDHKNKAINVLRIVYSHRDMNEIIRNLSI